MSKTYNVELKVYYWDDEDGVVYTEGGTFFYNEVIPNDDYSKVIIVYEY